MYDFSYSTCKQQCSLLLQQVNYLVATKSHHMHRSVAQKCWLQLTSPTAVHTQLQAKKKT